MSTLETAPTETGWNFADLWETLADADSRRARPAAGHADVPRGASSTVAPTGSRRRCSARRPAEQDKVAQYLYNAPEYLESVFAAFKVGLGHRQHQLPLRRRRARVPVGQRRRRRGRVPRRVRRTDARPCATGAAGPHVAVGRRRHRAVPDWATPYEAAAAAAHRRQRGRRSVGALAATTSCCSTPAAPPGMPKGVMWRQDDLFGVLDANNKQRCRPSRTSTPTAGRIDRARTTQPAGRAADARHRAVQRDQQPDGRRQRSPRWRAPLRRRRVPRHRRDRAGSTRCRSSATRSPSRSCARSTPSPTAGTSRRCASSCRRA